MSLFQKTVSWSTSLSLLCSYMIICNHGSPQHPIFVRLTTSNIYSFSIPSQQHILQCFKFSKLIKLICLNKSTCWVLAVYSLRFLFFLKLPSFMYTQHLHTGLMEDQWKPFQDGFFSVFLASDEILNLRSSESFQLV